MYFIGIIVVTISVIAGFLWAGGKLSVLWHPPEYVIIFGSAFGAFFAGNRKHPLKEIIHYMQAAIFDKHIGQKEYTELLCAMYSIFKLARTKSLVAIEPHIENPKNSDIFKKYPSVLRHKHGLTMFCDYMRLITMGVEDPMVVDDLMREEIDAIKHEHSDYVTTAQVLADSMPALGIVAAVLGIINSMGAIDKPPTVLGAMIASALVGTFFGILISYGFFSPLANRMRQTIAIEMKYYDCIKAAILAYMNKYPPLIVAETARKSIEIEFRPSYAKMEERINNLSD